MTTTIRSSADGSKSYIAVGGTDRVTIDAATGKLTSTYSPPTGERSLALATMQKFEDEFGASLAASGWQKLPSGLIIQWGSSSVSATSTKTVTFPITFPSACFSILNGVNGGGESYTSTVKMKTITTANFVIDNSNSGAASTVYWFSVGF